MPASTEKSARLLGDKVSPADARFMRAALRLARRAYGETSPNPMVGAVLVKKNNIIGQGWHHRAGEPHAEIEALKDAAGNGYNPQGSTLYVTLEPCCSLGRTPPCTEAIIAAGIRRVVAACTDPNPSHSGRGFHLLKQAGIQVSHGMLAEEATRLNEPFNHWIVHRQPLVTVKAAMTLDGKIATASGESKWITGVKARAWGMRIRQGADAILAGINTVLEDDPSLTIHAIEGDRLKGLSSNVTPRLRRIVLDSTARVPLDAKVTSDAFAGLTTVVVTRAAPRQRVVVLSKRVRVWIAPSRGGKVDLSWVLRKLGAENVTSLLVEGGGEVLASFLTRGLAHRVAFFYAPKILGGRQARSAVAGEGVRRLSDAIELHDVEWRRLGSDFLLTAKVKPVEPKKSK